MINIRKRMHCVSFLISVSVPTPALAVDAALSPMETLGKAMFFNSNLSKNKTQSCASCHVPETGFVAPEAFATAGGVVHGDIDKRSGGRKVPSVAYVTFSETFGMVLSRGTMTPMGGTFWDGRATGSAVTAAIFPGHWGAEQRTAMAKHLGPAVDQAMGPFINDVEQNVKRPKDLCKQVEKDHYQQWVAAWGDAPDCKVESELLHQRMGFAIAVWEASAEVSAFNSRRDQAIAEEVLNNGVAEFPLDGLSDSENLGQSLFFSTSVGCARFCHASSTAADGTDLTELFTAPKARYFNIGIPANPANPWYTMDAIKGDDGLPLNPEGYDWIDLGLAARDEDGIAGSDFVGHEGKFKVPTVRNVGKRAHADAAKAFGHNGYFSSLKNMVHFYNTRDQKPTCLDELGHPQRFVGDVEATARDCWPLPEVMSRNIFACDSGETCKVELPVGQSFASYCDDPQNPRGVGNLCLSSAEEDAIVDFLDTLSDQ